MDRIAEEGQWQIDCGVKAAKPHEDGLGIVRVKNVPMEDENFMTVQLLKDLTLWGHMEKHHMTVVEGSRGGSVTSRASDLMQLP